LCALTPPLRDPHSPRAWPPIEAACPDVHDPARRHASAARAWLEGDPALAVERYGAIVTDRPRDILALVVAHTLDFHLGQKRMMRVRLARVLPKWDAAMPGYASVLAMYAFALEENGQYRRAEKIARRALVLDPRHPGAIHVIAHVMEMQGRSREGLAFLAATESAWIEGTGTPISQTAVSALRKRIRGAVLTAADEGYDAARQVWNAMVDRKPGVIARCADASDVQTVVDFARDLNALLSVRGGGHNIAGSAVNDGGIVIDLSLMKSVQVDPVARTARVAPGVTLGELDRETQAFGLIRQRASIRPRGLPALRSAADLAGLAANSV
jgi:hypothetical protein